MEQIEDAKFEEVIDSEQVQELNLVDEPAILTSEEPKEVGITQEEFMEMWAKMHSPIVCKKRMPKRNEICPFCNSGKKFKNCECYTKYENVYEYDLKKMKEL